MRSVLLLTTGLLLCTSLLACDKDDAKGAASAPSASAVSVPAPAATTAAAPSSAAAALPSASAGSAAGAAASAQPNAPKCPPGLTGNAVPPFCIKLPAGYAVKEARVSPARGSIAYDTGSSTDDLMVSYDSTSMAEQAKDVESEMKFGGDKLEKKGDLPGGNKWFQGAHQEYERIVTLIKAPPLTLKCSFAYKPKSAPPKDALDACKSIVVP